VGFGTGRPSGCGKPGHGTNPGPEPLGAEPWPEPLSTSIPPWFGEGDGSAQAVETDMTVANAAAMHRPDCRMSMCSSNSNCDVLEGSRIVQTPPSGEANR